MSVRPIVFAILLAIAGIPVFGWYVNRVADGGDDAMGLLALAAAAAIIVLRRKEFQPGPVSVMIGCLLLIGYAVAAITLPPMFQAAFYIAGTAAMFGLGRKHAGLYGLLFLSLPVVASLQFYFGFPLRIIAAIGSSALLKLFGFAIEREATVLVWKGQSILVDPPCAGLNMLWMTGFLFTLLAAWKRFSLGKTVVWGLAALITAVIANLFRVFLLFFKESGIVDLPDWTHTGIGLLVYVPLVWLVFRFAGNGFDEVEIKTTHQTTAYHGKPAFVTLIAVVGIVLFQTGFYRPSVATATSFPDIPAQWKGEWMEPEPLPRREREFAKSFPGFIGSYRAGNRRLIIKYIERPTRRLHPISHCLTATGYNVTSLGGGKYSAFSNDESLDVTETIYRNKIGSEQKWHEVSEWYWHAAFHRNEGPWIAVVEIANRK